MQVRPKVDHAYASFIYEKDGVKKEFYFFFGLAPANGCFVDLKPKLGVEKAGYVPHTPLRPHRRRP